MWQDLNLYVFILSKATCVKKGVWGSECIAPWILDLDTIWKVASFTHRPLCRCYLFEKWIDRPKCQSVCLGEENGTLKSRVLSSRCSDYVDCLLTNVALNLLRMERQYRSYWAGSLFIISISLLWLWPWIYYFTLSKWIYRGIVTGERVLEFVVAE